MITRSIRPASLIFGLVVCASACGGEPPPPAQVAPVPAAKPIAVSDTAPAADLTAVARPKSLIVFARVAKPAEALGVVGGWSQLPMPGAEAAGELLAGESIGRTIDLTYAIDVAVALSPDSRSPKPMIAVSAGVRSLDDAKKQLSRKFKLIPAENGSLRIVGIGGGSGDDDDDGRPCALYPSFGAAATRLICADGAGAMETLAPYLARTAPRENVQSDVHAEILLPPVRPLVQQFRGFLPSLVGSVMSLHMDGATEALEAGVNDFADFTSDLDRVSIDMSITDPGASMSITSSFGSNTSLLARLAVAHPDRADVPPTAFWHLPVDSDMAYFQRGLDAKDIAHPKELLGNLLVGMLEKEGLTDGDRKALADGAVHYLSFFSNPMVYAKGIDAQSTARAVSAIAGKKDDAAKTEAQRVALEQLAGWSVMGVDDPIAKVAPIAREWVAAFARPGLVKWMKSKGPGGSAPTLKLIPVSKTAQLPAESLHLALSIPRAVGDADSDDDEPVMPSMRPGHKQPPPKAKPAVTLGKPLVIHVLVVPDGGHTWLTYAADEALATNKARAVLTSAAETGTLAKRADLETLRDSRANAAGFFSARGLVASSPLRTAMGMTPVPRGRLFEGLQATPSQGATPLPFVLRAAKPEGNGAGSLVITAKVPRAAIQDVVKAAIASGKF